MFFCLLFFRQIHALFYCITWHLFWLGIEASCFVMGMELVGPSKRTLAGIVCWFFETGGRTFPFYTVKVSVTIHGKAEEEIYISRNVICLDFRYVFLLSSIYSYFILCAKLFWWNWPHKEFKLRNILVCTMYCDL